jgi:hypothetical protein
MNTTFGIGNVLGTGFRVWLKNVIPFLLITAVVYAPLMLWMVSLVHGDMTAERLQHIAWQLIVVTVLASLVNILVSSALTYGVVMELRGQRATLGACIATGLSRLFPALGVGILSALCILGGTLLLFIPGIIVFCMLYVAVPASVLERPGVVGALRRSRELTRGHKMEIFGLVFLLWLLGFGVTKISQLIVLPNMGDPNHIEETLRGMATNVYVSLLEQMVIGSISAVMAAVAYYLLRAEKEGTSATELAAIFD